MKTIEEYKSILIEKIEIELDSLKQMLSDLEYNNHYEAIDEYDYHVSNDARSLNYWVRQFSLALHKEEE